jgi:TolB-like protein
MERKANLWIIREEQTTDETTGSVKSSRSFLRAPALVPAAVVVAILASGVVLFQRNRTKALDITGIKSVAVLPLKSFADSADDRALSLGFADALITSLGRLNQVRVISINSVSRYTDLHKEPLEMGKELGVENVFDGTMQKANGKLRITLRLIRVSDGQQIWSGSFDENEGDVFRLQDAMATQAAKALAFNLRPQDSKRPTENHDAYQAYLRGRYFFDKRTLEDYQKAATEFERAIALDQNYALPYTGLADVYALEANTRNGEMRDALYEKSRTNVMRALELDDSLAEAHTSLGWLKRVHDWDWTTSEQEFRRALEINPNAVNAHQWYALLLTTLGRLDEALLEIEQARELAPLSRIVLQNYFSVRQYRHEFDELPALAEQIASLENSQPANTNTLTIAYTRTGQYGKAVRIGEEYQASLAERIGSGYVTANRAVAYARTGQESRSREMLDYLEQRAKNDSEIGYRLAMAYAELGYTEDAIKHLQRCLVAHDDRLVWLLVESYFDSLRGDPRFQEILRKMKLDASSPSITK